MAREGLGETQPRTDRVASDRRPRRPNDHAGGGERATGSGHRQHAPLPTRVDSLPDLPSAHGHVLEAGLAALPLTLDGAAREAIAGHARLLLAWNPAINLTTITEPEAVARLHVLDSLTAVPLLAARFGIADRRPFRLLDIGSGGGYPGLTLAAALPRARVVLVDSVAKKARFLETVAGATELAGDDRVTVRAERAEAVAAGVAAGRVPPFDVVTARAVGALADLVELAFPLLTVGGILVAWKRGDLGDELAPARRAARTLGRGSIELIDVGLDALPGHRLAVVEKRGPTPEGYPRDPGRRARSRW
ncbi:MAG TPA: 16S rRNA (guanine(527)-N(7))-methyltransferase RsmG [Candidatus Limnocylindrales bacterium]